MSEDKEKQIKEIVDKRELEKVKLFEMMLSKKGKKEVAEQFKKFEQAHNDALEAYKNVA